MLTITMTKGLPGSGKSTWAEQEVLKSNCGTVRVNKDAIRAMMHASKHSKGNEEMVLRIRDAIIGYALEDHKHVIVDDTNFEPKHRARIDEIADAMRQLGRDVRVVEKFFDTPLEECLKRDAKRANGVGEAVIRGMYNKYLKPPAPEWVPVKQDTTLPRAIIVDIDGTLAKMRNRGPFEWSKVGRDGVHEDVSHLATELSQSRAVILMSGRDEVCRSETEKWLSDHGIGFWKLYMRPAGNTEKDSIIKERIYLEHIEGRYNVEYVLDDRNQVVKMWRSLGLRCLQVADGDF